MNLSRLELADFGSLDKIAEEIFRLAPNIPIPVPVEEIARQLDISDIQFLETDGFEGGLVTDRERSKGIILVNRRGRPERRRFSIGHELAHFLCPWHEPRQEGQFLCSPTDMRSAFAAKGDRFGEMEVQANRFSAHILLPKAAFLRDLKPKAGCALAHIIEFAARYKTSKEATARRYVELRGEPCAVVISHRGSVLRIYRGPDFPFLDVQFGHPVPPGSVTARESLPAGEPSDCEEIEGGVWFDEKGRKTTRTVYEEVLAQQSEFRLTLLSIDEAAVEADREEEDLRDSWNPRHRR